MGYVTKSSYSLLFVFLLLVELCYPQDSYVSSRATYYGSPDCYGTPTGACGYREIGRTVNDGKVTGVSKLYKSGTGCGLVAHVTRCKIPRHYSDDEVEVVVTDYGEGDKTDIILSTRSYGSLTKSDLVKPLFAYGVVDVEYKRVPCRYTTNLQLKVHEHSRYPEYLAIVILYVAGQNDIIAVDVIWRPECQQWRSMRRAFGAVFDTSNPPSGSLTFRVQVSASEGNKWATWLPVNGKLGLCLSSTNSRS